MILAGRQTLLHCPNSASVKVDLGAVAVPAGGRGVVLDVEAVFCMLSRLSSVKRGEACH